MAYRSNPKDWIAYYNFYISIALLSLWEAMTAQSLSKMAYTKDNFLWNIAQKKRKEGGEWGPIETLFTAFFAHKEGDNVNKDEETTKNILDAFNKLLGDYVQIENLTKTVISDDITKLLSDMQNIETNAPLLGISKSKLGDKENKRMDKFLNGKELINEDFWLSLGQVGRFFMAAASPVAALVSETQNDVESVFYSDYFKKLKDAANLPGEGVYKEILKAGTMNSSDKYTGDFPEGLSLHFGWIMFFVIIIVSQFTEKGKTSIEVVVFFIICFGWLLQYTILNPALKKVISIELIDFPKILTFLIFCIINSVIAVALVEMIRNEDDETRNGVYVLTTEGKKWRYGEWWEIIVSSFGSLTLGILLFQLLPYFFTSTKVPRAESKQKS